MYDIATIQAAFLPLVGWRNSNNPDLPQLGTDLTTSISGKVFNDGHPLVTLENIYATCPDFDNYNASPYDAAVTYPKGAIVRASNTVYVSLQDANKAHAPNTSPDWFCSLLSQHVKNLTLGAISSVVDQVLLAKKINRSTKGLLQNLLIFDGAGELHNPIIRQSRFVGFEITIKNFDSLQVKVEELGLQFTEINTDKNIYVFHSSKQDPIASFKFTTVEGSSFQWFKPTDFIFNFCKSGGNDAGGRFYVGYFEDDITGQALQKLYNFNVVPCQGCITQTYNRLAYLEWTKYVGIRPFALPFSALRGTTLPDLTLIGYDPTNNFGMNMRLTVKCDYTDLLVYNQNIFRNALQKQVTADVLKQIAFTTRTDFTAQATRDRAMLELKGDNQAKIISLEKILEDEITGIELDFSNFDSPCLGTRGKGIEIDSI
jgi:hypothetical protein